MKYGANVFSLKRYPGFSGPADNLYITIAII